MPCLNEVHGLAFCIEEAKDCIRRLGLDAEILIADNGSTDGSPQIAEQLKPVPEVGMETENPFPLQNKL